MLLRVEGRQNQNSSRFTKALHIAYFLVVIHAVGFGNKPTITIHNTFHQHIKKISGFSKFSNQARSPTKILAEKSVYSPWLICKLIIKIKALYFSAYQTIL
jgi:hypothetical protein